MVRRTARHDKDLVDRPDLLVGHPKFFDHDIPVLDPRSQGICDGLWLLIHLL